MLFRSVADRGEGGCAIRRLHRLGVRLRQLAQVVEDERGPLVFLGGFAWPLDQMPGWLATLAWLSPATGGMHAFVRLNQMGATLAETGWPLAILAILAALYGGAFMIASRWRLAGFAARTSTASMRGQDGG